MELHRSIILITLLVSTAFAQSIPGFENKSIRQFLLDDRTVYDIKIGKDEVTTLAFPGSITALEGAGITIDSKQSPAPVLLSYQEGRYYFSVRAVGDTAAASLNVIYRKKTYVLHLHTDKEPYRSVTFNSPEDEQVSTSKSMASMSPEKILSLIDRAKSLHLVEAQHPELVSQIETSAPNQKFYYRNFDVVLAEVFRFNEEDTLVFKLLFFNRSDKEIFYQPQTLGVRAGSRVFYSSLADASGILPAGTTKTKGGDIVPSVSIGYFAITGTPEGGRNNLSAKNAFNILVNRLR